MKLVCEHIATLWMSFKLLKRLNSLSNNKEQDAIIRRIASAIEIIYLISVLEIQKQSKWGNKNILILSNQFQQMSSDGELQGHVG